jgi:cytochrome c oxidase assembly factor CtaG
MEVTPRGRDDVDAAAQALSFGRMTIPFADSLPRFGHICFALSLLVGAMIFTWLLVLHIPRGITMNDQNEWTAVLEALAFSGIAFALVARPPHRVAEG